MTLILLPFVFIVTTAFALLLLTETIVAVRDAFGDRAAAPESRTAHLLQAVDSTSY